MAKKPTDSHSRIVTLSEQADFDQAAVYTYSFQLWGEKQAEAYLDFLDSVMQELANSPGIAPFYENLRNTRVYSVRWKNARNGHHIFFRETENGIYVMRILGSAMNWPDHLVD